MNLGPSELCKIALTSLRGTFPRSRQTKRVCVSLFHIPPRLERAGWPGCTLGEGPLLLPFADFLDSVFQLIALEENDEHRLVHVVALGPEPKPRVQPSTPEEKAVTPALVVPERP